MKVMRRDKRNAYQSMQSLLNNVVKILKSYKLIPNEHTLVKSKTKPQYLSKKRQWSFSAIFVVLGNQRQLKEVNREFKKFGIQRLNAQPSINFLNEKMRALEVFAGAKAKLETVLERFPGFRVKQIQLIDFDGEHLPNSDLIEKQIEEELRCHIYYLPI